MTADMFCMSDHSAQVVRIESVKHVEEVLSIGWMPLRKLVWEVHHEGLILLEVRHEVLDRELLILWDNNELYICEFEECFPLCKNCTKEVFIHHDVWREIKLH